MENNQLVPMYQSEDAKEIIYVKGKRKNKKPALKGLILLLFIVVCAVVIFNFSKIKSYLFGEITNNTITDTDTNASTDSSNESPDTSIPENLIPDNCFEFFEATKCFEQLTNESSLEIGALEYSQVKASEIYSKYGKDAPVVLIIHSSALESYSNGQYYSVNDQFYSRDKNVSIIGEIICSELNSKGINAIHISNIFANGGIYSSTKEYESAITQSLKKYPSIEYVLDISRGIKINSDLSMKKPINTINNVKMAQVKITVGSDTNNNFWEKNLSLALKIATENNDIVSDVILSPFSLSQELSPSCLQIDVGDFSNTFEEASYAAIELSNRLCHLIS